MRNDRISDAFRATLPSVRRGSYICVALENTKLPAWGHAAEVIRVRLGDCFTYGAWLQKHHRDVLDAAKGNLIPGRVAWVKALIEEFKAKGD